MVKSVTFYEYCKLIIALLPAFFAIVIFAACAAFFIKQKAVMGIPISIIAGFFVLFAVIKYLIWLTEKFSL